MPFRNRKEAWDEMSECERGHSCDRYPSVRPGGGVGHQRSAAMEVLQNRSRKSEGGMEGGWGGGGVSLATCGPDRGRSLRNTGDGVAKVRSDSGSAESASL